MSYRSWLKDVSHINDIDPWHVTLSGAHPDWDRMEDERAEKFREYYRQPLPPSVQNPQFFNSRLHDSQFLSLTQTKNQVTVSINDLDAELLVIDVCDMLDLSHPQVPIPIDFVFHDVAYCTTLRYDRITNALRYDNIATAKPNPNFELNYKRDRFVQQDGRLQWIAEVITYKYFNSRLSDSIYIIIDCATATAVDRRLPALQKLYGPNIIPLWNDYLNRIDFPEEPAYYLQNFGGFYEYFERRLPAHGLTWEDLLPKKMSP